MPIENFDPSSTAGVAGSVMGAVLMLRWWWKTFSRDRTDVARDGAERSLYESLRKRAEEAESYARVAEQRMRDAFDVRDRALEVHREMARRVEGLEAKVLSLANEVERLNGLLRAQATGAT